MSYSIIGGSDEKILDILKRGYLLHACAHYVDIEEKAKRDWLFSFFYHFRRNNHLADWTRFSDYVRDRYTDPRHDKHTLSYGSQQSELRLVNETLDMLDELKKLYLNNINETTESDYLIFKFFMLTIMSREKGVRDYVLIRCDDKANVSSFFDALTIHVNDITQSSFNQFKSVPMMTNFVANLCSIYSKVVI